jgi:release factor glutamine methyltransferase
VVATDIDPRAVRCARINVARSDVARRGAKGVEVRQGDLFEPVRNDRFDLVLFNPPYLATPGPTKLERSLRRTPDLGQRFARELIEHLTPGGRALVVLSTNGEAGAYLGPLRDQGFRLERFLERDRGSELLTVWSVSPADAA